jgi:hypothetical protein
MSKLKLSKNLSLQLQMIKFEGRILSQLRYNDTNMSHIMSPIFDKFIALSDSLPILLDPLPLSPSTSSREEVLEKK